MADIPGGPKKETVYNGPSVPMPMNGSYGAATAVQPKKETIYNGPVPGATVYNPARNGTPKPAGRNREIPDSEGFLRMGNLFFAIAGISLFNSITAMAGSKTAFAIGLGFTPALCSIWRYAQVS